MNTNLISIVRAEVERRKNTAETLRERNVCIDILDYIDTLQEQPVKDFPTTDEEMQHFLATHKPVQVPEKYKTADWLFQEQPVCEDIGDEVEKVRQQFPEVGFAKVSRIAYHFYKLGQHGKPKVDEELEVAAEKFAHSYDNGTCDGIAQDCFKAGAEWRNVKDGELMAIVYGDGIRIGMTKQKEQMMKEALNGEIMTNGFYPYEPRVVAPFPSCPYEFGTEVKVIVIKED